MKNNRRNHRAGFTLAELLMTIAILAVLFGIGFVNVIRYQRQLKLTENNDIAREIFTAAQNRMTSDKANGIWDEDKATVTGKMTKPANFGENTPVLDTSKNTLSWPDPNEEYVYALYDAGSLNDVPSFLPLGSIDESVRTDGHYIIEYNRRRAAVYGVWYSDTEISYGDVSALDKTRSNDSDAKKTRLEYKAGNKRRIIGYYGNAVAANIDPVDISLKPNLEIHNDDILFASISFVNDPEKKNEVSEIKLTVDGLKSKATVTKTVYKNSGSIDSKDSYAAGLVYSNDHGSNVVRNVVLDDITSDNGHFANIFNKVLKSENTNSFIPGEDIRITAKFTVNGKEVKRTATTNSLFAQISDVKGNAVKKNAAIANTRHLENLSKAFSSVNADSTDTSAFIVSSAEVIKDISFNGNEIGADGSPSAFISRIAYLRSAYLTAKTEVSITTVSGVSQTPGRFYAISSQYLDTFEGNMHKLSDFDISASDNDSLNTDKDAGLFANAGSTDLEKSSGYTDIKDLLLEDFSVEGSRNVGTLIGTAGNGIIENVAVYATNEAEYQGGSWNLESNNWSKRDINYNTGVWSTGGGGTAGGFIGSVDLKSGDSGLSVSNSFAAVPVRSSGDNSIAGGLVGSINTNSKTVNINNSYAGGFVEISATDQGKANYSLHNINIISGSQDNGITGGLIGEVSGTNLMLDHVYSTTSAAGHISGGLIGLNKCNDLEIRDAYSAGTVYGLGTNPAAGCFIGTQASPYKTSDQNKVGYLHNGKNEQEANGFVYASNAVGSGYDAGTVAFTYDQLDGTDVSNGQLKDDSVTDADHTHKYNAIAAVYPFPAVSTMDGDPADNYAHYGDWPSKIDLEKSKSFDGDFGILYYEKVQHGYPDANGNISTNYYYHGYVGYDQDKLNAEGTKYLEVKTENTLVSPGPMNDHGLVNDHEEFVVEQGYLILVDSNIDKEMQNKLHIDLLQKGTWNNSAQTLKTLIQDHTLTAYNGDEHHIGIADSLNISGFNCYYIAGDADVTALNNGHTQLRFSTTGELNDVGWDKSAVFAFNPMFSDITQMNKNSIDTDTYTIRSAESYNRFVNSNYYQQWQRHMNIVFDLDLDYDNSKVKFYQFDKIKGYALPVEYSSPTIDKQHFELYANKAKTDSKPYTLNYITGPLVKEINASNIHDLHIVNCINHKVDDRGNVLGLIDDANTSPFEIYSITVDNLECPFIRNLIGSQNSSVHDITVGKYSPSASSKGFITDTSNYSKVYNVTIDEAHGPFADNYTGDLSNVKIKKLIADRNINQSLFIQNIGSGSLTDITLANVIVNSGVVVGKDNAYSGLIGENAAKISKLTVNSCDINANADIHGTSWAIVGSNTGTIEELSVQKTDLGSRTDLKVAVICSNSGVVQNHIVIKDLKSPDTGFVYSNSGTVSNVIIENLETGTVGFVHDNMSTGYIVSSYIKNAHIGKYGFAVINKGEIQSCQIFGDHYEDVSIGGKNVEMATGFAMESSGGGTIKRSSVTGTITGKSAAGFLGIQSNNNGGNYTEDCYSNVLINVTGGNPENSVDAAGFILNLKKGGVANSHSLGIIRNASQNTVTAAGFAGSIATEDQYNTKFDNNYAAIWDNPGVTNYGLIYVKNHNLSFTASAKTIRNTIAQDVNVLSVLTADQLNGISDDLTKAYRQYGDPAVAGTSKYPYSMPEGMIAYGDWSSLSVNVPEHEVLNKTYVISSIRQGVSEKGTWRILNADGTVLDTTKYLLEDNTSTEKDPNDQLLTFKESGSYIVRYEKKNADGSKSDVIDTAVTVEPLDITVYYNGYTKNTVYMDSDDTGAKATVSIAATAEGKLIKITSAEDIAADEQTFDVQVDGNTGKATVTFNNVGEYQLQISTANGDKTTDVIVKPHSEYNPTDVIRNEGDKHVYSSIDNNNYHFDAGSIVKIDEAYYVAAQTSDWLKPADALNSWGPFVKLNLDVIITEDQFRTQGASCLGRKGDLFVRRDTGDYYAFTQDVNLDQYYSYYNIIELKFSSSLPSEFGDVTGKISVTAKSTVSTVTAYFNNTIVESEQDTITNEETQATDTEQNTSDVDSSGEAENASENMNSTEQSDEENKTDTDNTAITDETLPSEPANPEQPSDTAESTEAKAVESSSETTEEGTDPSSSPVSAVSDAMMHRYASVRFVPYKFALDEPGSTEDPEGEEGKDTSTVVLPGGTTGFSVDASPVDTESSEPTAEPTETSVPAETDAPEETIPAVTETAEQIEDAAEPVSEEPAESSDAKPDAEYDVVTGETFDLSVMNPVREGYTLIGWRVLNGGEDTPVLTASVNTVNGKQDVTYSYATNAVITVTGDLQLEAVWSLNETAAESETAGGIDLSKYMNSTAGNPYPLHWDNCTWSAWTLCKAYTGISLPGWGDAKYWYARAQKAGFKTGSAPAVNSLVCFDNHVGFVSAVSEDGQYAYIQEGNWGGTYHEGWWPAYSDRHSLKLYGYIYLGNYEPNAEILVPDPEEIEKQAEEQQNQSEDIDYTDPVSSEEPEVTPTPELTATEEPTATPEHTAEPTPEHTAEPTPTPTPEHTAESTPTPTPEQSAEPTPADTPESTATPEVTAEPEESPAEAAVPEETAQPTPEPTALETEVPEETAGSEETAVPEETVETPEPVVEETPAPEESVDPYEAEKAACTEPSWWNDADHVCVVPEPTEEPVVIENSEQPVSEEAVE